MSKKKTWVIILSILFVGYLAVMGIYSRNLSKDMTKLIEKAISKRYDEKKQIDIFTTYEIYDNIVVGFTLAGKEQSKSGYAVLEKLDHSRYKLKKVNRLEDLTKRALDIYIDYISVFDEKHELESYLLVIGMNAELSKVKLTINDGKPINKEVDSNPSLTLVELPNEPYEGEYLFYDKSGNLIE